EKRQGFVRCFPIFPPALPPGCRPPARPPRPRWPPPPAAGAPAPPGGGWWGGAGVPRRRRMRVGRPPAAPPRAAQSPLGGLGRAEALCRAPDLTCTVLRHGDHGGCRHQRREPDPGRELAVGAEPGDGLVGQGMELVRLAESLAPESDSPGVFGHARSGPPTTSCT